MSLKDRLIEQITLEGPMSVADYMTRCLLDPLDGYYIKNVALGAEGDFITAPLVSQMFGEMIGVWIIQTWEGMGSPAAFRLVEIGGGDGPLMSDILRVLGQAPELHAAAEIVMIEPSPVLRKVQSEVAPHAIFLDSLDSLGDDKPIILIANEILDCLPVRQFGLTDEGWHERRIGVIDGALAFGLVEAGPDFTPPLHAEPGRLYELSMAQAAFAAQVARRVRQAGGAALLIDYGRDHSGPGDTLQALYRHEKVDPLAGPGEHDLTVWADFPSVSSAARHIGVSVSAIVTQGAFLHALGIEARLGALTGAHPAKTDVLQRQYDRLTAADQMGELFKVIGFAYPETIPLTGLEDDAPEA